MKFSLLAPTFGGQAKRTAKTKSMLPCVQISLLSPAPSRFPSHVGPETKSAVRCGPLYDGLNDSVTPTNQSHEGDIARPRRSSTCLQVMWQGRENPRVHLQALDNPYPLGWPS